MTSSFEVPTRSDLDAMFSELKNWDRWGPDDERGTLNHLGPDSRRAGASAVRQGISVSLAFDLRSDPSPENPFPVHHHMLASGDARDSNRIPGYEAARDYIGLDIHGLTTTHVDALSHMFVGGQMYGGRPASLVRSDGATMNTILSMADGVVARGVLVDVPRALGIEYLGLGEAVTRAELEETLASESVEPAPGDVVLIRWGRGPRRAASRSFDGFSGLHPDCLPWIHEHGVSVLGSDGISDPMPGLDIPTWPFPVHQIGITGMGLYLIDNMALDELARACAAAGHWDFLFTMGPLRIPRGTGCPVNPIAVL